MRKFLVLLAVVLSLALGTTVVIAQDSTPEAEEDFGEGVSFEFLGYGETEEVPSAPVGLSLLRLGIEPGGFFPIDPADPALALVVVETGAVTITVEAPITVLHPTDDGAPGPEDVEQFAADEEFTMEEGDSAIFPPNIAGEARNDGDEDVSLLIANVAPVGEGEVEEDEAATPVT